MSGVKGLVRKSLARLLGLAPPKMMEDLLLRLAHHYSQGRGPEGGLRFLLSLDSALYNLQGSLAVAYGGGVHTKHRHTRYHDFFVGRLTAGERVLDIGCGNGALAHSMASRAQARVLGIDLEPGNIEKARARHAHPNAEFRVGDALSDIPQGDFRTVVLSNVLEHLPGRPEFLRRVTGRIGPERFLIRVPLFERDWRVPLKKELGLDWRADPTHHTEYTLEQFQGEMDAAGLSITHLEVRWGEIWAEAAVRET